MNTIKKYLSQEVILEAIDDEGEKIGPTYRTKIIEIIDSENIYISLPVFDRFSIPFPEGTKIKIIFKDVPKERLCLIGNIVSKDNTGNGMFLKSRIYNTFDSDQRRLSFRLDCKLDAIYKLTNNPIEEFQYKNAYINNISGGGLNISVCEDINAQYPIEVTVFLEKDKEVTAICKVVRKTELNSIQGKKYNLGLIFTKISNRDHDLLIKYIFEKQRKLMTPS